MLKLVSTVPSQTELLHTLGLREEVVGITKFCVHPAEWFQTKTRIGGTKTLDLEKIAALVPDLIIANKEENERSQIEWLQERFPVWISEVGTLADAYAMIIKVGQLTGTVAASIELTQAIQARFATELPPYSNAPTAAYFIWRKPYMAVGKDTFIHAMLQATGMRNVFDDRLRYPEITPDELAAIQPELILLSSEPYPFAEKHLAELQKICPHARIALVDGELFSWYGSRLLYAPAYFRQLRHKLSLV